MARGFDHLALRLAQWPERGPDFVGEQLGLFPGGEVATVVGFVEVGEGGVGQLDPAAGGPEDLAGEAGEADRDLDWWGAWPAAWAAARPLSQYDRAAEAPVPVSQYRVMLSRIVSRLSWPAGWPSTKARAILW
jgi:hypothetical protein